MKCVNLFSTNFTYVKCKFCIKYIHNAYLKTAKNNIYEQSATKTLVNHPWTNISFKHQSLALQKLNINKWRTHNKVHIF